ncbi:UDP-glucosyltransferase 2, partial [Teleopsis dalmanni]|uniref:UDP-glucosyltransferase 2 n=1 Tax=Teleopsis dalmanni TaxID=139649 RepID=UPI0018CF7AD7
MVGAKIHVLLVTLVLCAFTTTYAANILCLMNAASKNQQNWADVLFKGLADRDHELTVITPVVGGELHRGINYLLLDDVYDAVQKSFENDHSDTMAIFRPFRNTLKWYERELHTCKAIYASKGFRKAYELSKLEARNFDLIIYDVTYGPGCLWLTHYFKDVPIVGISAYGITPKLLHMARSGAGALQPSTRPHFTSELGENMNFFQRLYNSALYGFEQFFKLCLVQPVLKGMYSRNANVPAQSSDHIEELRKQIKIILVNSHPTLDYAQLLPPNVIEVGGLHIQPKPETIKEELLNLVKNHKKGGVLIDLGDKYALNKLTETRIQIILDVIQKLPDRLFIWKVEKADIKRLNKIPKNLQISDTISNSDILALNNVKVFFTQADVLNAQEAIYSGKPLLTLAFNEAQYNYAQRIKQRNCGIVLDFTFTVDTLENSLRELLDIKENTLTNIRTLQQAFKSRPQPPLETALWWIEQTIAEPHSFDLLVTGKEVERNFFIAHSWDILLLFLTIIIVLLINSYVILRNFGKNFKALKDSKNKKNNRDERADKDAEKK